MSTVSDIRACIGIDIGGTKIEAVACGADLQVRLRQRVATPGEDFNAFAAALAELIEAAERALGATAGSLPVGLGIPGVVDAGSGAHLSSNVPALCGRRVAAELARRLGRQMHSANDCQCFALSEAVGGAADGAPSMFGVILGTGAGGGYCIDGRLVRGSNGTTGEWGHWTLPTTLLERHALPLLACPCGKTACLERYVSGSGLAALHMHLHAHPHGSRADASAIATAAKAGDPSAQRTLAVHLDLLAHGLAGIVMAIDPHVLVLGGGLSQLDHLYTDLPAAVRGHLFAGIQVPPILPPRFGAAGGARGAALLTRQRNV